MVEIKGLEKFSPRDYPGIISATVFLGSCNFRCPYCHNASLVLNPDRIPSFPMDYFADFLNTRKDWLEGICVTGGEPLVHRDLGNFLSMLKERDLMVKLDTNGSFPSRLEDLIAKGLIDSIAMDVKAPLDRYEEVTRASVDQEKIRKWLSETGLVAFIADGSILPRRSGVDDRPLLVNPVPFYSPDELAVNVDLPHQGMVRGMGIPPGVTLIVGGGFHGKSTFLNALEVGVYNHIPGDGREYVITDRDSVKIRAENGRSIQKVNISSFITNLPLMRDTIRFSTENGSGSTSQAASIIEALESGARILLIDEDTSATNFMIRDERMQELVVKEKEPITPFVDKVHKLYRDFAVSTLLVMGGSGDYFDVADTVIMMD